MKKPGLPRPEAKPPRSLFSGPGPFGMALYEFQIKMQALEQGLPNKRLYVVSKDVVGSQSQEPGVGST